MSLSKKDYALAMFAQHPELFPEPHREPILNGQVVLGMTPFEAKLAGGAFSFKVIADTNRWPPNADPYKVMWSQSMQADDSQIWMTFKNATQYPGEPEQMYRVCFRRGLAVEIEKLKG